MVTLPRLGRDLASKRAVAGTVCPTFDGDLACWGPAVERLLSRGGRGTLFALGAGVSGQPGLPPDVEGSLAGQPRVGLETLSAWAAQGLALGSLGMTGVRLTGLSRERLRIEMFDSRRVLVEAIERPVECLAWPDGAVQRAQVHMAASVGYRWACTGRAGVATAGDHTLLLPRLEVADAGEALALARGTGRRYFAVLSRVRRLGQRRMMRGG